MEKKNGFTLIELLVVITIIGIILGFAAPNYNMIRDRARITAQKMNMHNVATAVETYFSEKGEYAEDFYEDGYGAYFPGGDPDADQQTMGKLPTNPWTGINLEPEDFDLGWYDTSEDVCNTEVGGPNDDDWDYDPGQMRFWTYTPLGTERIQLWGLIGMDRNGRPMRDFDAANETVIIFVLHN